MKWSRRAIVSCTLVLALVWLTITFAPAWAGERQEDPNEATVRDIALGLRCAVCQNQPVYESNSDLAKDMLKMIRQQVQDGRNPTEIRQYFHDRYGDYIYLEPTRQGSNWILWAGPFLLLLGGAGVLGMALRRWRHAPPPPPTGTGTGSGEASDRRQQAQRELDRVDL
ncbi:MAG: cytochrome c-type biogenesis protein CcmH [Magnetococcales bacterium]|nr:cytochrome c-type biogenesis protein CcmH [Magnetococcales bacterium]